jgi:hypothetical protein
VLKIAEAAEAVEFDVEEPAPLTEETRFARDAPLGREWIRTVSSAMLATADSVGAFMDDDSSRRQQLYPFAEADDCADDNAVPTVDRPRLGRSLETAAYLARN